jgi:hypothetical protein
MSVADDITDRVGVHSRRQVGIYRARIVDKAGHLTRPTVVFEAPDDATAIARARALADDDNANIEVWHGTRRVDLYLENAQAEKRWIISLMPKHLRGRVEGFRRVAQNITKEHTRNSWPASLSATKAVRCRQNISYSSCAHAL